MGWTKMSDTFKGCKFTFEGDASKFGRNVLPEIVETAFSITRSCYRDDRGIDRGFRWMKECFINKILITPDGSQFKFSRGIPSGSVWTSWIGSLCTWIMWNFAFYHCPVFDEYYYKSGVFDRTE
jgi:hypothetical protein